MIELTSEKPTTSGFYFVTFYNTYSPEISPEIFLESLTLKNGELYTKYTKDQISLYDTAAYSIQLPDYITPKFIKRVNENVRFWEKKGYMDFAINESKYYDETFSVFINTNGYIDIFTQHIDGKVDTCSLRGKDSLNVMKNILNHHENDKPNQSSSWDKFREQAL